MRNSPTIRDVILAPGNGSFFYDDQAAIRAGAAQDGFCYLGAPLTPGFPTIRIPSRSLSIGLVMSDDTIVWGDMMNVQYSGAGGREPVFQVDTVEALTRSVVIPRLLAGDVSNFLGSCNRVLAHYEGKRLPLAVEYGVSQALLRAAAYIGRTTLAEVICSEYRLPLPDKPVPIYAQSGDSREINVDKMILKSVDVLPHGLINSREKFGPSGEKFREFVKWVVKRTKEIGQPGYHPVLHFDVYGWIGLEIGMQAQKIADFIARVADDAPGYRLHIECPADFGSTEAQLEEYAKIVALLDSRATEARVVVDEQCNTLDDIRLFAEAKAAHLIQIKMPDVGSIADSARAVLVCKENGVGAYMGGSCTETDLSARAAVNIAVATQADMMLARPGMGVDEGISIVGNEQSRLLSVLGYRRSQNSRQNVGGASV
ncbi:MULTISPECIES: methylaspartate ammonia-lyase [unclassified Bradyrhizobium]|uniref:methylaspartate ammonia-lyase n=1 Tax=unclassified Bradyrhizobium TaxID=2631580 RepID=UPI001CD3A15A|nr:MULTISPECIES: methylaspartate ammonia-lyase [unclassified Bradyrhizobium]MCA1386374.1 methylaspartate ammonia-lyase [Bradyrhizobium sp. BRP05]MCA1394477.1 methylaspartate ammonia-lyase [Bradyrhizobium sp. IC3123]MCA1423970.1 methylaspartate ammonia-lyase [Bradyrhizobium sp. BRP23]MCA1431112.1 methylaspartate ammonia-lyase [Bradyrhizobium sp. NBAIM16]MCA1480548.1 methylaspartate ammonia-lyase [Bradyrhizobium sp. NBAIM08]